MLIETTVKYGITFRKNIRNKWYEWFVVKIAQGEYMPFYLPVTNSYVSGITIAWIWYLVPVVLPLFLVKQAIMQVYVETRRMLIEWTKYNQNLPTFKK